MTFEDDPSDDDSEGGGYRRPPKRTRFKKRQSGNRAGRPPGRFREAPYDAVLGRKVTVREDGIERSVTAAEAFLLKLKKSGLEGDSAALRACLSAIEKAKELQNSGGPVITTIVRDIVAPGSVTSALEPLPMAKKLDPYRETARMMLEPWLVEEALARLDRKLSPVEQRIVVKATRTPHKVKWPAWWGEYP